MNGRTPSEKSTVISSMRAPSRSRARAASLQMRATSGSIPVPLMSGA
jgi:hypothetical protein